MINSISSFFDQPFFKDILSALIGAASALLVFFFTIRHDRNKEKKKEEKINENRIVYLSNLVSSSIKQIANSIKNLQSTIELFEEDEITYHYLIFSPNSSLIRLQELLKNENYFLAYMQSFGNNTIDDFNEMSLEVDFFKMQIEQVWDMHKNAQMYDYERKKQFKVFADSIVKISGQLTQEPNIEDEDKNKIALYIKGFYNNHPKKENEGESITYYYSFIRKVLGEVVVRYSSSPHFKSEWYIFKEASSLYHEIKFQNEDHKNDLIKIRESLKDGLVSYREHTSRLVNVNKKEE